MCVCVRACVRAWIRICAHTSNVNGFNGCFLCCCIINQVILNPSCPESQGWIWWGGKSSSCSGWSNQVSLPGWIWIDLLPINNYRPALYQLKSAYSSVFIHGTIATALFTWNCFQWRLGDKGYLADKWPYSHLVDLCFRRGLEKEISLDFGPSFEFAYLYGQCYDLTTSE